MHFCTQCCVSLLAGGDQGQFYEQFRTRRAGGAGRNSRRADDVSLSHCLVSRYRSTVFG